MFFFFFFSFCPPAPHASFQVGEPVTIKGSACASGSALMTLAVTLLGYRISYTKVKVSCARPASIGKHVRLEITGEGVIDNTSLQARL